MGLGSNPHSKVTFWLALVFCQISKMQIWSKSDWTGRVTYNCICSSLSCPVLNGSPCSRMYNTGMYREVHSKPDRQRELKVTRPHYLRYRSYIKKNISEHWFATVSSTQSGTCNRVFGVVGRAWGFKSDGPGIESRSNVTFLVGPGILSDFRKCRFDRRATWSSYL